MALPIDVFNKLAESKDLLRANEARLFRANVHAIGATFGKNTKIYDIYKAVKSVITGETLANLGRKYGYL